ncbi:protein tantalus isoform X2 [Prorops nasuta]|uniref:protein tantalus isoform X2 n=1 Tax=Prorops nasuta TaxID=863751 RepID=UPI0034CE4228
MMIEPNKQNEDTTLPALMAGLEGLKVNTTATSPVKNKMVLRRRAQREIPTEVLNRRCSLKPKKRTLAMMEDEEQIKEYYLDKSLKKKSCTLETIFEERDVSKSSVQMGAKRFKRMIKFEPHPTDSKIKKRRAKIKKLFGSKASFRKEHITMQLLVDKLNGIRSDSPTPIDNKNLE